MKFRQDYSEKNALAMPGKWWSKFCLLMWKNWVLQYRHPLQTVLEIIAPILFSCLLVLVRTLVEPKNHKHSTYFKEFEIERVTEKENFTIVYSPYNKVIDNLVKFVSFIMGLKYRGFKDSDEMVTYLRDSNASKSSLCGIEFDNTLHSATTLPPNLKITIRFPAESRFAKPDLRPPTWETNVLFPEFPELGPRSPKDNDGGYPPGYNSEKFLTVQHYLSYAAINFYRNISMDSSDLPKITMQRYPYPPYIEDPLLKALATSISIVILLSFVYTCINTVKVITAEKEKQLKETMKIMGLPNWLHWLAWFVKDITFMLISVLFIVILLKVHWVPNSKVSLFTYTDATVIFCFLLIYMCTTIMFCFMISTFFSRANVAATMAGLLWFFSYSPYLFLEKTFESMSLAEKISTCLGSNSAMAIGFHIIVMTEATGRGLQWDTIHQGSSPDDSFIFLHVIIMLIADAIIYLLIALYVEAVFPGQYGVPLPWYFPVTSAYWCGTPRHKGTVSHPNDTSGAVITDESDIYEREPFNLPLGVQIDHLCKKFGKKKAAVNDLCLNLYEGQITVLLGHNGAGKTTTMSMLTGMFPPTSGTAKIDGHDIISDMPGARRSLGLCPQHNILYDDLTVKEHIYFFSKLKGLSKKEIDDEINKFIDILELRPKAKAKSKTLSGGMKRKLSVCIALCGFSKVVILDEPTAGMDPAARRALWDLLQAEKKGRTILLSTHFMDEADLLGDRIAIMSGGTLQCCGSSFFLKKRYGAGYHLTMEKSSKCDVEKVTILLQTYIPKIKVQNNIGSELTYLLPEVYLPVFEKMLKDLEEHTEELGILNYGISLTTMEEVFMKVGADLGLEDTVEFSQDDTSQKYTKETDDQDLDVGGRLLTGKKLFMNQILAMIYKKMYSTFRSWILLVVQIIIPVAFIVITIITVRSWHACGDLIKRRIVLEDYKTTFTVVNGNNTYKSDYIRTVIKEKTNLIDLKDENIEDFIVNKGKKNLAVIRLSFIVGATFYAENKIKAWFNNEPYHSSPLALNLVHNAVLKTKLGKNYNNQKIEIVNHPQPFCINSELKELSMGTNIGFQIAFNVGFGMAFVTSFFIIFYVRERISKSKHLQFVSGVNVFIFWITAYIWDLFTFIFTSLFFIATLWLFHEKGFSTAKQIGLVLLVIIIFGHAMLPIVYLCSFLFDVPATGYVRLTLIFIFTGVAGFLVVQVLSNPSLKLKYVADGLEWVLLLVPHFALSSAILNLYQVYSIHSICKMYVSKYGLLYQQYLCSMEHICCSLDENHFEWEPPGIGKIICYMIVVGFVSFIVLLIIEYRFIEYLIYKIKTKLKTTTPPIFENEDEDVNDERKRVNDIPSDKLHTYHLVLKEFSKYYNKFLAVQRLSVAIQGNECFGLLGVNGAGKTSTFKMLTGDEKISFGDAWVHGLSLKTNINDVHKKIGYCPQFDALLDDLTGRETMLIFSLLHGVTLKKSRYIAEQLANDFGFTKHIDKRVKQYSGGNKRKLSTALALIGGPVVIYLDEPTAGMDPAAKRYLWNALCKVRDSGKCIVLTSHSMEECEALCTRLAIMVNGNFKCIGSTQHLKSKFSEGYTLTVKIKKIDIYEDISQGDIDPIDRFIKTYFPSAILMEQYQELFTYYISDKSMPWSKMFGIMEKGKKKLEIEDYSLGQASLEQVFLKFTKYQKDENV